MHPALKQQYTLIGLLFALLLVLPSGCGDQNDSQDNLTDTDLAVTDGDSETDGDNVVADGDADADRDKDSDTEQETSSEVRFTILHTNDVHAHIEEFDSYGGSCDEAESQAGECFGGVARHATYIANVRAQADDVLLLDAGDRFQGSLYYSLYKGEETYTFMNMQAFDAMVLGNHEFDNGLDVLASFLGHVSFPVISANVAFTQNPAMDEQVLPYVLKNIQGRQVAIIGLTSESTPTLSSPGDTVRFDDLVTSAQSVIDSLQTQGVHIVVLLTHIGLNHDEQLATALSDVDVIIGGHSHSLLSNSDSADGVSGPYPLITHDVQGDPVLIATVGQYGEYVGRLNLLFDTQGKVQVDSSNGEAVHMDATIAQEPRTLARVTEMSTALDSYTSTVIGQNSVELNGDAGVCRFYECTMGDLVSDAMQWQTSDDEVEIAVFNAGGIRASIDPGDIDLAEVYNALPFGNSISTFQLSGQSLLKMLEHSVSVAEDPENDGTGRFLQVSGLRLIWNPAKPVGERLETVEIGSHDTGFTPLNASTLYRIATNNYIRQGGDGYNMLAEEAVAPYDYGMLITEAVTAYVSAYSPVTVLLENRILRSGEE